MFLILSEISTFSSIIKLVLLLLVFFALLYGAHIFTKWYAKSGYINSKSSNIKIVETQQIAPGKNIVIAKVGEKYVSFLMMKENAILLTELSEDELDLDTQIEKAQMPKAPNMTFSDMMKKVKNMKKDKDNSST